MNNNNVFSLIYKYCQKIMKFDVILNIFFVYKNCRKGCINNIKISEKQSNSFDKLLTNLGLYYQKYKMNESSYIYCISKNKIKYDLYKITKKHVIIKNPEKDRISKFLGYLCGNNVLLLKAKYKRLYRISFNYTIKNKSSELYSYICNELNIDNIYKEMKRITKMNKYYIFTNAYINFSIDLI